MIPELQQWDAATRDARIRWATAHGMSVRQADTLVRSRHLQRRRTRFTGRPPRVAPLPLWDPPGEWTARDHLDSLAGDTDPLVVAHRRAAATGLALTHHDVTTGLPAAS